MNRIIEAAEFATAAHEGQIRKYVDEPYIRHPARVAARIMLEPWASETMVIAALLHDTVEDCAVTHEDILDEFGPDVAKLVHELTDQFTKESHPELNRKARKELERERLGKASIEAKAIKLADIADNLTGQDPEDKFTLIFLAEKDELLEVLFAGCSVNDFEAISDLLDDVRRAANQLRPKAEAYQAKRKAEKAAEKAARRAAQSA